MARSDGPESGSILKELIVNQYQAILLVGTAAVSLITLSPLPLLVLAGAEFMMVPLLDSVPALRRRVHRRRRMAGRKAADGQREQLVASFDQASARTYHAMVSLCAQIEANYQSLHGISQVYLTEQRHKLDMILEGCIHRLTALQRYERMLANRTPRHIEAEITNLERELQSPDLPERARAALNKNLELKRRLLQSHGDARDTMKTLTLELDSMVSLLEVLHQNSISMRDPQAISEELDTIVRQSEDSERAVREMEALMRESTGWGGESTAGSSPGDRKIIPISTPPRKVKER